MTVSPLGNGKSKVDMKAISMHALDSQMNSDECQACDVAAIGNGVALTFTISRNLIVEASVPMVVFG